MEFLSLISQPVEAVSALPVGDLSNLAAQADEWCNRVNACRNVIVSALERRYADRAQQKRAEVGKDYGSVNFEDNGFTIVADAPKRVKWDQVQLRKALDDIDVEIARHLAKLEISIDERKFQALAPRMQDILRPARIVTAGKASYTIKPVEA